jgi:hypothetical protein
MTFDKEEYWKRRHNEVEVEQENEKGKKVKVMVSKPLRGQGDKPIVPVKPDPNDKSEVGFDLNGNMIHKNRAFRRRNVRLPGEVSYTKKTYTREERKILRKKGRK